MEMETPEGKLTISDDKLTLAPYDDSPELQISLDPMPEVSYERSIYGEGHLSLGTHTIRLRNDDAPEVIAELRRPRAAASKTHKSETKPQTRLDSDHASTK